MTSTYRGLYRVGPAGNPTAIQVLEPGGNSMPFPFDEYVGKDVKPEWNVMPKN